jgi:hypothetical protein
VGEALYEEGDIVETFRLVKGDPENNGDSIRGPVTDLDEIIDTELVHFGREGESLAKTASGLEEVQFERDNFFGDDGIGRAAALRAAAFAAEGTVFAFENFVMAPATERAGDERCRSFGHWAKESRREA